MNGNLFAIEVTDTDLKLLRVRRDNGTPVASPLAHVRRSEDRDLLASTLEEHREDRPQAVLVLNSEDLEFRDFSYPFEAERKVRHAIDFELSTDYPAEAYLHDYVKSHGREPGYHAYIAAMVPRPVLEERVRVLEEAGVRITGITADVSTLGAAFREEDEALVMDTGERHTMFVLYRSGLPVLLRKIPIGIRDIVGASGDGDTGGLLQLGAEIKRTVHSFNAKVGLELNRLFVTGSLLLHRETVSALRERVRMEITLRSVRDYGLPVEEASDSTDVNVFAALIGSAFWKRRNGFFNFLRQGFVREEQAGLSPRRLRRWGWGFAAAALLLLLLSYGLDIVSLQARRDFLRTELRSTFTSAFPRVTRVVDELKQANNMLNAEQAAAAGGTPQGSVPLITALRTISATIPETVPFQIESLFWESGKFEIYARTDSFKTVNTIQELLAGSDDISQAAISNARHREEGEDVEFKLSVRFAG
jgi:type II secretory pathway component PulL